MKTATFSVSLLIIAMFFIPVGGMCDDNLNRDFYMYGFLGCEILSILSIARCIINLKRKQK